MTHPTDNSSTIQQLARQLRRYERRLQPVAGEEQLLSTGIAPLDDLLPDNGIARGSLMEWLSDTEGGGAGTLVFRVAAQLLQAEGACVVIDPAAAFYPPGAGRLTDSLQQLIVVHPTNAADALWALEQSLRCRGVAVVICRLGHAFESQLHTHAYRRLQLAAETSGAIGLLLRPARYRTHPSWADVRLLVEPLPGESREWKMANPASPPSIIHSLPSILHPLPAPDRQLQLTLLHCRGRTCGGFVKLEIDDETGDVRLAAELAAAANQAQPA